MQAQNRSASGGIKKNLCESPLVFVPDMQDFIINSGISIMPQGFEPTEYDPTTNLHL